MATKKISQLDPAVPLSGGELIPIVQDGRTRKGTTDQLAVNVLSKAQPQLDEAIGQFNQETSALLADAETVFAGLGYLPPVPYAAGLSVSTSRFTVSQGGQVYAPVAWPFATGATFNPAQWRLVQGVAGVDLGAQTGAGMVGYGPLTVAMELGFLGQPSLFEVMESHVLTGDKVLVKVRDTTMTKFDREIAVCIPYDAARAALYRIGRENIDGLIRRGITYSADFAFKEALFTTGGDVEPNIKNGVLAGTWMGGARTPYTATPGDTVTVEFEGTGISFAHYRDNRGGVWGVHIDGVEYPDISTWSEDAAYPGAGYESKPGIVKIATGLKNEPHTLVLTFKGDDPAHAPTGGVARGWIVRFGDTDTTGAQWRDYGTFRILKQGYEVVQDEGITMTGSNVEVAILLRPDDQPALEAKWFPEHGGVGGSVDITSQVVKIDGEEVDIDDDGVGYAAPGWHEAKRVQIVQKFTVQHPDATATKLMGGALTITMTPRGFATALVLDVVRDTFVAQGYSFMPSMLNATTVVNGAGDKRTLAANDGTLHPMASSTTGVMFGPGHSHVVAWELMNPKQSQRIGKAGWEPAWMQISDREAGSLKQYNYLARNGVIPAGERIVCYARERCVEIADPASIFQPAI